MSWDWSCLLRIPDLVQEKYKSIQASSLKNFEDSIKGEAKITKALTAYKDGVAVQGSTLSPGKSNPVRTMASPDWDGEPPKNFKQVLALTGIPLADFEGNNTLLCKMMNIYEHLTTAMVVILFQGNFQKMYYISIDIMMSGLPTTALNTQFIQ